MSSTHMLSVREVAEILGIRTHGVATLIHNGSIRAVDVSLNPGGRPRWRIDSEELSSFIRRRTHTAAPPRRKRRRRAKDAKEYF
jgi:excisionase family DNA binding protein